MLPEAWIKRVTKEEAKRAKSNHTVKMMLPKEYQTNVVAWTKKNVARDVKRHSLRNALLISVSGDREKTAMWRLDECEVSGQTICLQAIPARMSCDEIEAGSDPRGHLGVTWGVYLCAGKPPLADIILSHPPDLTRCDSVMSLAIPAMSGHIQYRGAAR